MTSKPVSIGVAAAVGLLPFGVLATERGCVVGVDDSCAFYEHTELVTGNSSTSGRATVSLAAGTSGNGSGATPMPVGQSSMMYVRPQEYLEQSLTFVMKPPLALIASSLST